MSEKEFLVEELTGKRIITIDIQILKSEYRDKNVKGKFYAHLARIDKYGSRRDYWNTDDYDSIDELKKAIKKEYKDDNEDFKFS